MENGLKELLESSVLNEETKTAFLEAWNEKVNEVRSSLREEVENEIREEFSARYENDRNNLVEAMDRMLTDQVQVYAKESVVATKALNEEKKKLTNAIKEARADYKNRVANHTKVIEGFVLNQLKDELVGISRDHRVIESQRVKLAKEISEAKANGEEVVKEHMSKLQTFVLAKLSEELGKVKTQEKTLAESRVEATKKLREHRISLNEQTAGRINKLEKFVVEQLTKELAAFQIDKDKLVEKRVQLIAESQTKLEEAKKAFVARASKIVESTVKSQLTKEMTQLKEDIRTARENYFGRRLFEAFQAEFMGSYLSEGTQVKKLTNTLTETEQKLNAMVSKFTEQTKLLEQSSRRIQLAEERATRVKTMSELLSPLSKEKKAVMEEILESVKTQNLKEAFTKYLPAVSNDTVKVTPRGRQSLTEAPVFEKRTVAVTGNRQNRLAETARAEDVHNNQNNAAEIVELRRLAGIDN